MLQKCQYENDSHQKRELKLNMVRSTDITGFPRKFVKNIFSIPIFCWLMVIYVPFYIFLHVALNLKIAKLKLQKYFGNVEKSELDKFSRRYEVSDVSKTSTEEALDFMKNRSFVYYSRLTFWTCYELAKMFAGLQSIPLISDSQLVYVIMNTVCAHSVSWCNEKSMYLFQMKGFENLTLFRGFYFDARSVYIKEDYSKIIIIMYNGQEYHSDCDSENAFNDYNQAKLHLQVCLTYYVPGLAHNHVHFVFPSTVCVKSKQVLSKKGYLYKLLSPHFRFTEAINYQAIRIGKSSNNTRSIFDRYFIQWQAFPITMEQFVNGIAEKCESYYCKQKLNNQLTQKKINDINLVLEDDVEVSSHDNPKESDFIKKKRCHSIFPPKFVTDKKISQIPYMRFLRGYYFVVRSFVEQIEHFIDLDEWKILSKEVSKYVPHFDQVEMIDGITTFIHQAAIVHYCDHKSYLKYFAWKYGCLGIRYPFELYEKDRYWEALLSKGKQKYTLNQIKKYPNMLIKKRDIMRTKCFLNVFVDYIPSLTCNLELVRTKYYFENDMANNAASKFITNLRSHDAKLKNMNNRNVIRKEKDDERAEGLRLVDVNEIIRTICY